MIRKFRQWRKERHERRVRKDLVALIQYHSRGRSKPRNPSS